MDQKPTVAINGFGRIGRLVARALLERGAPVNLVAVNDLAPAESLAYLFQFDSVHGRYPGTVTVEGDTIVVDGQRIKVLSEKDPERLPWKDMGVDYVVESTGRFTTRDGLEKHLRAGAKRVVLSAPGKDVDITLVRGVNMEMYDPSQHRLVSNASCTTNCLAPLLKVLDESFGVAQASMTTIHGYTNDQHLVDSPHKDPRRARAAALSMIPTSTGAAKAIGEVLPNLAGKVDGMAVRVPVPNTSLVDLVVRLDEPASKQAIEETFRSAASGGLKGLLAVENRPLVSVDFNHNPMSATVDFPSLMLLDDHMVKVLAWYDNEWGYSNRTAELLTDLWAAETEGVRQHQPTRGRATTSG